MLDCMVAYPDAPLVIARSRSWRAAQARKKTRSQTSAAVAATHAAMQRLHAPPTEQATPPTAAATNDSVRSPACPTSPERRPHSRPSTVGAFVFARAEQRCGRIRHLAPPCTNRRGRAGVDDVHGRASQTCLRPRQTSPCSPRARFVSGLRVHGPVLQWRWPHSTPATCAAPHPPPRQRQSESESEPPSPAYLKPLRRVPLIPGGYEYQHRLACL